MSGSSYITPLNIIQVANLKRLREIEAGEVSAAQAGTDYVPHAQWAGGLNTRSSTFSHTST